MFQHDCYEEESFSNQIVELTELCRKKFVDCNFTATDFSDLSVMYGCTFERCNLSSAKLNGVDLRNCAFLNCRFRFAALFATTFDGCKMTGSSFLDTDCSMLTIHGGDWSYTDLRHLDLDKRELREINFTGADLSGAKLTRCIIECCVFQETSSQGLSLRDSDLRNSDLAGLDLLAVDLKGAKVDLNQCIQIAEAIGAKYEP